MSSSDQESDLERQIQYLTQYCSAKGYRVIDILSDAANGLKTDRRGLLKLFNYVVNKQVDVVVLTCRGRLIRFGFEYLEYFFKQYGAGIEIVYGDEPKDTYQELVEDNNRYIICWKTLRYEKPQEEAPSSRLQKTTRRGRKDG